MALLMAGQRLLADDHTWTSWQPHTPTHATFNIIILKHMHDADKANQASHSNIFSVTMTPKWVCSLIDLSLAEYPYGTTRGRSATAS